MSNVYLRYLQKMLFRFYKRIFCVCIPTMCPSNILLQCMLFMRYMFLLLPYSLPCIFKSRWYAATYCSKAHANCETFRNIVNLFIKIDMLYILLFIL